MPGCIPDDSNTHVWATLIPSLVFHSTLCSLAAVKCLQWARFEFGTSRVMIVLVRDSATYFGGILVITVINMVIWSAARVRTVPPYMPPAMQVYS